MKQLLSSPGDCGWRGRFGSQLWISESLYHQTSFQWVIWFSRNDRTHPHQTDALQSRTHGRFHCRVLKETANFLLHRFDQLFSLLWSQRAHTHLSSSLSRQSCQGCCRCFGNSETTSTTPRLSIDHVWIFFSFFLCAWKTWRFFFVAAGTKLCAGFGVVHVFLFKFNQKVGVQGSGFRTFWRTSSYLGRPWKIPTRPSMPTPFSGGLPSAHRIYCANPLRMEIHAGRSSSDLCEQKKRKKKR